MVFVETRLFTRLITELLADDAYSRLQIALVLRPDQGPLIRGAHGLRKLRWALPGQGKRGSLRIFYLGQAVRSDLHDPRAGEDSAGRPDADAGPDTRPDGAGGVQMKKTDFEDLVAGVREAGRIKRGELAPSRRFEYKPADVRKIRDSLGLSQSEFALLIGVSVATLQNWEQGRRRPEGPARALLRIAATHPEVVKQALTA